MRCRACGEYVWGGACLCWRQGCELRNKQELTRQRNAGKRTARLASGDVMLRWWNNERPACADDVTAEDRIWGELRARRGDGAEYVGPAVPSSTDDLGWYEFVSWEIAKLKFSRGQRAR